MQALLVLILILLLVMAGMWATFGLIHLALMLLMAGFVGWLADVIVPGRLPYGWLGAIVAGLIGGWIGQLLIGRVGPDIFGVRLIPALLGAIILAFLVDVLAKGSRRRKF